jgi:hypothetical protein
MKMKRNEASAVNKHHCIAGSYPNGGPCLGLSSGHRYAQIAHLKGNTTLASSPSSLTQLSCPPRSCLPSLRDGQGQWETEGTTYVQASCYCHIGGSRSLGSVGSAGSSGSSSWTRTVKMGYLCMGSSRCVGSVGGGVASSSCTVKMFHPNHMQIQNARHVHSKTSTTQTISCIYIYIQILIHIKYR